MTAVCIYTGLFFEKAVTPTEDTVNFAFKLENMMFHC